MEETPRPMPQKTEPQKLKVDDFADQIRGQLIPLRTRFSYFFTGLPFGDDDVKEYLEEPVEALPKGIRAKLPEIAILLVPYLERGKADYDDSGQLADLVSFERPEPKWRIWDSIALTPDCAALVFGAKDQDVAEYHYRLYQRLASVLVEVTDDEVHGPFQAIVREELGAGVHGEVDETSWELKQALLQRQTNLRRKTKGFAKYARQALVDTLTLYMHGICCDIDVDTGPRQLASRHLRRRLELLQGMFPAPKGYAVFPEEQKALEAGKPKEETSAAEPQTPPVTSA
jgi:hypothetical protein